MQDRIFLSHKGANKPTVRIYYRAQKAAGFRPSRRLRYAGWDKGGLWYPARVQRLMCSGILPHTGLQGREVPLQTIKVTKNSGALQCGTAGVPLLADAFQGPQG